MYYRVDRRYNILQVNDTFASLQNINKDGSLDFEFRYKVSQSDSITRGAVTVDVSVITRTVKKRPILGINRVGKLDSNEIIDNILSDIPAAKSAIKSQEYFVLNSRKSDISAFINNEIVNPIRRGIPTKLISAMYSTRLKTVPAGKLQEANDNKPVLDSINLKVENIHNAISSSIEESPQNLNYDLILRRGIDPSNVTGLGSKMINSYESFHGILQPSTSDEVSYGTLNRLHDHLTKHPGLIDPLLYSADVEENKLVDVVVTDVVDELEIPIKITFKQPTKRVDSRDSSSVFVKFQLLDVHTGASIDTVIKPLDIPTHIRIFHTPITAPIVKQQRSDISSRANLLIDQIDKTANEVHVFKKNLYTSITDIDDYTLIGVYPVKYGQHALVQVDQPTHNTAIYRVIPSYSGVLGFVYTNIVVKPKKYCPIRAISLTAKIVNNGISIEARKIPPDVIAIQFVQRNLSIYQKTYDHIQDPILIDDTSRYSDYISIITSDVQDNNVYEFSVILYHKNGIQELSSNEIIEYMISTPGKVDINVSDIIVSHDSEPNVTFSVNLNILDTNLDSIKELMEKQGINVYFEGDIAAQRDQLKSLLACSIHRIDLSTGDREDFGVMTQTNFNDANIRKNFAALPLKYGRRYRYVITAIARAPETILESLHKTMIDNETKKAYIFKPSKFLHPLTLRRGIIVSPQGLKTRYTKSALEHGTLGVSTTVEISFDDQPVRIVESSATQFNKYLNLVSWRVDGALDQIDHFIIMKEIHGIRVTLGTIHSSFDHGNCQWTHKLTPKDRGEIKYNIVPVLNDYKHGSMVTTNSLLIEES